MFNRFGSFLTELKFKACNIQRTKFIVILKHCLMLKSLTIDECHELFKSWEIEFPLKEPYFSFTIFTLKHLSLANNDFFSEHHFDRFVKMAPNLVSLDVSNCFVNMYEARRVPVVDEILRFVNMNTFQMEALNISGTASINDNSFSCLSQMDELSLKSASLNIRYRIPLEIEESGIGNFIVMQRELLHLDLSDSSGLNDQCLDLIITSMPLLKTLKLKKCWLLTDRGVKGISNLIHLECLDLSNCEKITDYGIMSAVTEGKQKKMSELYLSYMTKITDTFLMKAAITYKNIETLDLENSINCITDCSIQYISCYLINLKHLNLHGCSKVNILRLISMKSSIFNVCCLLP